MSKRPRPPSKKSARDRAIEKALLIASQQPPPAKGGTILVRREDVTGAAHSGRQTKAGAQSGAAGKTAIDASTIMALALAKAGITPTLASPTILANKPPAAKASAEVQGTKSPATTAPPSRKRAPIKPKSAKKDKTKPKSERPAGQLSQAAPVSAPYSAADAKDRASRMVERQREAANIIANIGRMTHDHLLDLWRKQAVRLYDERSAFRDIAVAYVQAIEGEWRRRTILAKLDPDHFPWPSTLAAPGDGAFATIENAEGILGYMGYHVGKTGDLSAVRRQSLLRRIFEGNLPPINGPDYMDEWGQPETSARLRKMAESIASAVRSAKRRHYADYSLAIEHWEEDLMFLYNRYYVDHFSFYWPVG